MSSLAASSSVTDFFPPAPPMLAHSRNINGDFGSYVSWWSCPCYTCTNYREERASEERPETPPTGTPIGLALASYAPVPAPEPSLVTGALSRAPANQTWNGSEWVPTESEVSELPPPTPSLTRSLTLGIGGADPRLLFGRSSTPAVSEVAEETEESSSSEERSAPGLRGVDPQEDDVMARLQHLRARLIVQQDSVYDQPCDSHDEMAAQDAEWNDLDVKIDAIESLLQSFGVVFRTR